MSYILEAIKKADHKRKLGEVPDLHTDHHGGGRGPLEPEKRPLWPYLLAIVLFLNAGGLYWWLSPSQEKLPDEEGTVSVSESIPPSKGETVKLPDKNLNQKTAAQKLLSSASVTKPIKYDGKTSLQGVLKEKSQELAVDADTIQSVDSPAILGSPSGPSSALTNPEETKKIPPAQSVAVPPALPQDQSVDKGEKVEAITDLKKGNETKSVIGEQSKDQRTSDEKETDPLASDQQNLAGEDAGIDEDGFGDEDASNNGTIEEEPAVIPVEVFDISKIPFIYQLPPSVQENIPDITISFHSYTFRPATRMARVNGRILREGQSVTEEITLDKIVPSGAVFLFDKKRFRVDI